MTGAWACFIKIKSKEGLRSHVIDKPSFVIGRAQEADLPIIASTISRLHLAVHTNPDSIMIADQRSANGTYVNGKKLQPGQALKVAPGDVVKFGTLEDEFTFMAIPKPFEMMGSGAQKNAVVASMEEHAKQLEARLRAETDKEVRQARLEADQARAEAKREIESFRTQATADLQTRRAALDTEIAKLRQGAQLDLSEEKVNARRQADLIVAEAHSRIQRDFEDAAKKIEEQFQNAHEKSRDIIEGANAEARRLLSAAREEAGKIRIEAADEARQAHQEALRKSVEGIDAARQKLDREITEKRAAAFAEIASEVEKERERFTKEHAAHKESVVAQTRTLEKTKSTLAIDVGNLEKDRIGLESEVEQLKGDLKAARKLLSETEEIEARRDRAEKDLKEFSHRRESGLATLDRELEKARERNTVEIEKLRRDQESKLAKERLAALAEIDAAITAEEKKYQQTRELRAIELVQKLHDRLLPRFGAWVEDPTAARTQMKHEIESVVLDSVATTSIKAASVTAGTEAPAAAQEHRDRRFMKYAAYAVGVIAVAVSIYGTEIYKYLIESQKDSFAAKLVERRRIQSIYSPVQIEEYRDTYTENVLYKRGYFEMKTDPATIEKWTLKLNDLKFLKPMKLSEEDIVKFIAKETNLVQRLGILRNSIDAVYLSEGLERMRAAENEDVAEMIAALKSEHNYRKIRAVEKEFLKNLAEK